jgi:hypothetical protein
MHPFRFRHVAAVAAVIAPLAIGGARARADLVPTKRRPPCTAPGQPCSTTGLDEDPDGTCVAATCTVQVRTRDGGTTPVGVPCFHCTAGAAKGSTSQPKSKASGCAVAPERGGTGSLAVTALLIAGVIKRRQRLRA